MDISEWLRQKFGQQFLTVKFTSTSTPSDMVSARQFGSMAQRQISGGFCEICVRQLKTVKGAEMQKFLVISYDNDEQQSFRDFVYVKDEEAAKAYVEALRPYAIAVEVLTFEDCERLLNTLDGDHREMLHHMRVLNTYRRNA